MRRGGGGGEGLSDDWKFVSYRTSEASPKEDQASPKEDQDNQSSLRSSCPRS